MRFHDATNRPTLWLWVATLGSTLVLACGGGEDLADPGRQISTKEPPTYQALAAVYLKAGYSSCTSDTEPGCDDEIAQWAYQKSCKEKGICGKTGSLRLSKAFKDAGHDLGTIASSADFQGKLTSKYRKADFSVKSTWQALSSNLLTGVPWGQPGIIGFLKDRNGKFSGYIDLWTGQNCLGNTNCSDWNNFEVISFWVPGGSPAAVGTPAAPSPNQCQIDHGVFTGSCPSNGPCLASAEQVCGTSNCDPCDCSGGVTATVQAGHICSGVPSKHDQPASAPVNAPASSVTPAPSGSGTTSGNPPPSRLTVNQIVGGAYTVVQSYGPQLITFDYTYCQSFGAPAGTHCASDIGLARGTPLYAAGAGRVISAGGGSKYADDINAAAGDLRIKLTDGTEVIYGHSSVIEVAAGASVTAGQRLGLSGSGNGNAHLHLEVRVPDASLPTHQRTVDPVAFFGP